MGGPRFGPECARCGHKLQRAGDGFAPCPDHPQAPVVYMTQTTANGFPPNWPLCPRCGRPSESGRVTCGDVECAITGWTPEERARRALGGVEGDCNGFDDRVEAAAQAIRDAVEEERAACARVCEALAEFFADPGAGGPIDPAILKRKAAMGEGAAECERDIRKRRPL